MIVSNDLRNKARTGKAPEKIHTPEWLEIFTVHGRGRGLAKLHWKG